ncbi:hypothetical protein Tco_1136802 [Tanacetum coccineum]
MDETLSKFMSESAKRHEENSNMIKEIRASMNAVIQNQRASIKTLEIEIGQISKVLQERGFGNLPSSTEANPRDHVKSISTTVEADTNPIRRMRSSQYAISRSQNSKLIYKTRKMTIPFPIRLNDYYCKEKKGSYGPKFLEANLYEASHIDNSIPQKEKDPELATVKYPKGITENMLVGIGKFVFPVDFIILDMPEDVKVPLILKRPFLSTARAKIDVFKRKITLRLRRDQVDDLMPTIKEGEVIKEVKARNDRIMVSKFFGYPSVYDQSEKIRIDYKIKFRGRNELGDWDNVPIFIGKFYVLTNFTVVEDMDPYLDEGIGEVVVGEPFCKVLCVETKRFDGMITIHGEENV